MDSVTQVLLGAAVGEAVAGRKAGNKAILWGAVAGTIPDLDVISRYFMDTVGALDFHRGPTHSITFALLLAPLGGYLLHKLYRNGPASQKDWTLLVFLGLFTHPLLDCFTTWGTNLFWPFSDYRVAFKSIFVVDPLYTIPLLICVTWCLFLSRDSSKRKKINQVGLILSSAYLFSTLAIKYHVNQVFDQSFERQHMTVERFDTKPAPLNTILWACTAETADGYYIGYYSLLDSDRQIDYHFFSKNHQLLKTFDASEKVNKLVDISNRWYTLEEHETGLIFNDLRFGQGMGWEKGTGKFVFSYHIFRDGGEVIVQEREKDMREGKKMIRPLWERIMGR